MCHTSTMESLVETVRRVLAGRDAEAFGEGGNEVLCSGEGADVDRSKGPARQLYHRLKLLSTLRLLQPIYQLITVVPPFCFLLLLLSSLLFFFLFFLSDLHILDDRGNALASHKRSEVTQRRARGGGKGRGAGDQERDCGAQRF